MLDMKYLIPTDKKKTESEILLEARMNIQTGIMESVQYEKIMKVVSEYYGVDGLCRSGVCPPKGLAKEQRVCMYLLHEFGGLGYDEIAEIMRQKERVSVVRKIDKVIAELRKDEELQNEILGIVDKLK